jgi:hypothetical protein
MTFAAAAPRRVARERQKLADRGAIWKGFQFAFVKPDALASKAQLNDRVGRASSFQRLTVTQRAASGHSGPIRYQRRRRSHSR